MQAGAASARTADRSWSQATKGHPRAGAYRCALAGGGGSAALTSDPALAIRWLVLARRAFLALQLAVTLAAEAGTDLHLHHPALLAVLAGWAGIDAAQAIYR